jgi:hypothetical protein
MTHCWRRCGFRSFFEHPPDRLLGDGAHHRQLGQPVGQQPERPPAPPIRGLRAGQGDEPGLGRPVQLGGHARPGLGLVGEGGLQPLLDQPLSDPLDRPPAAPQGLGDPPAVPARPAVGLVGL